MKNKKPWGVSELLIILSPFVIMALFILAAQNKALYQPHFNQNAYNELAANSEDQVEEITIKIGSGTLHGWGYQAAEDAPTVIYFGGNFQTSDAFAATMNSTGEWKYFDSCNVVMIDYPGYGKSGGKTNYKNIMKMVDAVYSYISEDEYYGNNKIISMGFSLGTGPATYMASTYRTDGLILVAPYNNGIGMYNSQLNIFHGPLTLLVRNPYPNDEWAKTIAARTLIIASEADEVIDYAISVKLADSFADYEFVSIEGAAHANVIHETEALKKIEEYLNAAK